MSTVARMVLDDPSKFPLLTADMKLQVIKGAIATANVMAALGRKEAVKNVKSNFINRNTFTVRQIQFTPMAESKYIKLTHIHSELGATSKAPYMARQETGGKHTPAQGNTLAIPTDVIRGGTKYRPVAPSMRVDKIKGRRRVRSKDGHLVHYTKSQNVARAYTAITKGLFLPIGGTDDQRNLFQVTDMYLPKVAKGKGHRERAKHRKVAFKLKQVYKFDQPETMTEADPWLLPASEKVAKQVQAIFNSQMKKLGM